MDLGHAIGVAFDLVDFGPNNKSSAEVGGRGTGSEPSYLRDWWRTPAAVRLLIAVAIGTTLRFLRLGARQLSIDESLSWAESAAQSAAGVIRVQHQLDSGKFPIYELTQHLWIAVLGDSEAPLRALSALIGSPSIVLVFMLARELLRQANGLEKSSSVKTADADRDHAICVAAALCALLFAVALPTVEIARQARMYSMLLAWILLQAFFLLRARRRGGLVNYGAIVLFAALAVATNFTAILVIVAEGAWIFSLCLTTRTAHERPGGTPLLIGAALLGALLTLAPFYAELWYGVQGVARGDYDWIGPPGRWEPIATFESALGSWPFPLFAIFALIGGIRLRRAHREAALLLILWLTLPPIVLFAGSYLVTPMLVTRYLISSFVPLLMLTAIGIESLPAQTYRTAAIFALAGLSILTVSRDFRLGDNSLREACEIAVTEAGPEGRIGALREYYLISYYTRAAHSADVRAVRMSSTAAESDRPRVVVVSPTAPPKRVRQLCREYPFVVARFKNVTVRSRAAPGS
jgi:hypothetical protein